MADESVMSLVRIAGENGIAELTSHLANVADGAAADVAAHDVGVRADVTWAVDAREGVNVRTLPDENRAGASVENDMGLDSRFPAGTLRPRHLPLAVTLRDPALEHAATARPTRETAAFERAAAEELLQARDAALSAMRRKGVLVLDVAPRGAAEAVVERYRQLKRRGIL